MAVAKEKDKDQRENMATQLVGEFGKVRAELRKVVWPSREETIRLTVVVILISSAIGFFLFIGDTIFIWLYSQVVNLFQ